MKTQNTLAKAMSMTEVFVSCILLVLFAAAPAHSEDVIVLRVIDETALARLEPDSASEVIKQFPMGARLEAKARAGDWYEISFKDSAGFTIAAYIHASSVEVISEAAAPSPQVLTEPETQDLVRIAHETGGLLNGFFLKFGVIDKGWGDWIGSLGYAIRLHKNISLGLEVMPSYTTLKDEELDLDLKTWHSFSLANLRAGTSLFFLDPDMDFFKIYAGLGGGAALSYTNSTIEGNSSTLFKYNPALQILGGFELDTGKVSLLFEYQMFREFEKDVESSGWVGYLIFGIRF
jgi:hypothetical protein